MYKIQVFLHRLVVWSINFLIKISGFVLFHCLLGSRKLPMVKPRLSEIFTGFFLFSQQCLYAPLTYFMGIYILRSIPEKIEPEVKTPAVLSYF